MGECERCGELTKRKGLCPYCKGVIKIANKFNVILPEVVK